MEGCVAPASVPNPAMSNDCDVIVLGSGAAGLTAALAAHESGAHVRVIERFDRVGGTSAISGGVIWVADKYKTVIFANFCTSHFFLTKFSNIS